MKKITTDSNYLISMFSALQAEKLSSSQIGVNADICHLTRAEINSLVRSNGVLNTAVYEYPNAASNTWFNLNFAKSTSKDPSDVLNYLMNIPFYTALQTEVHGYGVRHAFRFTSGLARKLGSAYIVLGVADSLDLQEPINLKNIQSVEWLYCYDCYDLIPDYTLEKDYFTLPNNQKVHSSRVLKFYGNRLDTHLEYTNSAYKHDSIISSMFNAFSKWVVGNDAIAEMLLTANMYMVGIEDLGESIRNDVVTGSTDGQQNIKTRAQSIKDGMSVTSLILYDLIHEKIETISRNFGGVKESLETLKDTFATMAKMPRWKLFNEFGTAGLASSVDAAKILNFNWALSVKEFQTNNWLEPLHYLLTVVMSAKDVYGGIVENFTEKSIEFPIDLPLDEKEKLELENLAADRSAKLINMGAISPLEVRKQYESSVFNPNLVLDDKLFEEWQAQKEKEKQDLIKQSQNNSVEQKNTVNNNKTPSKSKNV